jgi:hypothetical protein
MWRYLVGAGATLLLVAAGLFLFRGTASPGGKPLIAPQPAAAAEEEQVEVPGEVPSATARTREQKRFDRVDKDKNDSVTRDEFFALRRKAFAKLDADHDGKLSFEEWSVKAVQRFAGADKDKSGALTRAEFATTAQKRKAAKPRCACAPAKAAPAKPQEPAADDSDD